MIRTVVLLSAALAALQGRQPFRSGIDIVRVPVLVTNGARPVAGLTNGDFELRDSGVLQPLTSVFIESQSVDVTLVLDASGSVQGPALERMKTDVQRIADDLDPRDRVRLITFGDDVRQVFGFRPAGPMLPVDTINARGASPFYAAIASALIGDPLIDRPQVVFTMSDGRDNLSFLSADKLVALAGFSNAAVYIALVEPEQPTKETPGIISHEQTKTELGNNTKGVYSGIVTIERSMGPYIGGPNVAALKAVAARTGGAFYDRLKSGTLPDAFRAALADFRNSYLLTYTPAGVMSTGWHPIDVRVKGHHYTVRARKGYEGG